LQRISPFKTLDAFRGFAALWVVMDHSCDRWLPYNNFQYLHVPLYAFSIRGQLGVSLFFLISGYCITAAAYGALISGKSVWRYGFERIRRIYPPYLAALLLTSLSLFLIMVANKHHWIPPTNHLETLPLDAKYWVGNLMLLQYELNTPMINSVFWSLSYEVAFYAVIGIFLAGAQWVAAKRNFAAGAGFFASAVGISTAMALIWLLIYHRELFPLDLWHQFSIGGLLFFLIEWNPETVEGYTPWLRWTVISNIALVAVLTTLYAALRQVGALDIGHPSSRVRCIVALFFAALLIALRPIDKTLSSHSAMRPMIWLGAFSYSLYLTHPIVLPYIDILCRKAGLSGSLYWITFWIEVAISIVFGGVFFHLIEKRFISKRQVQRLAAEQVG
jgi:exopolysaccharide production protein ExoZ